MTHEANRDEFDWGTAAARDGQSLYGGFEAVDANTQYLFALADTMPRRAATVAAVPSLPNKQDGELVLTDARTASGGGGAEYIYHAGGKSAVTTDPGFLVSLGAGDDYLENRNTQVANALQFGATADGTTDDTAAIQAAIDAAEAKYIATLNYMMVFLPYGTYLVTSTLNLPLGVSLLGESLRGCRLKFNPTANDTCIAVNTAGVGQAGGITIKNFRITSSDTSWSKVGIDVNDVSAFLCSNIEVDFSSTGAGKDDVGVYIRGRDNSTYQNLLIQAAVPLRIGNTDGGLSLDNVTIEDTYLISSNTTASLERSCVLIDDGCEPQFVNFRGRNAWAKGDRAIYHNSPASTSRTQLIRLDNVRHEQGTAATKHAFYFNYPNATGSADNIVMNNCSTAVNNSYGIYTRFVNNLKVDGFIRQDSGTSAAGAMLDIDDCIYASFENMQVALAAGTAGDQDYSIAGMICIDASSDIADEKFPTRSVWVPDWSLTLGEAGQPFGFRDNLVRFTRATRLVDTDVEDLSVTSGNDILFGRMTVTAISVSGTVAESASFIVADRAIQGSRGVLLVNGTANVTHTPSTASSLNVYGTTNNTAVRMQNLMGQDLYVMIEGWFVTESTTRPVRTIWAPTGP